ncbi:Metal-dependent peptidase [Planctomycetales bacterium 10988]|nr:Metal-dependent peptidase [Planctomycetales bacterium 10988]
MIAHHRFVQRRPVAWLLGSCVLAVCWLGGVSITPVHAEDVEYSEFSKDTEVTDGVIKLHKKKSKLYFEISKSQLNQDFLVLLSIARGIGERSLLGGMSWGFGDDWLWRFEKVDDENIHLIRRNTRFRADQGSPEADAVDKAYSDSVLYNLPIHTTGPGGTVIVDVTNVFMSDLPQISRVLPGFVFSSSKSTWADLKGFDNNVEIRVSATYASSGSTNFDTVPDSRGLSVDVHYSISRLPNNGYQPRLADPRVGYFLTAVKDFSKPEGEDRFIRYVNRWNLKKADASADLSPPAKPIIFWMEKTIPYKYRSAIREGILEWNRAFEKVGFLDAIEVRQQSERDTWMPEDVNYNTFRWITAGAGFAMGPSRVNPYTGEILDADIIFDADFVNFWKVEYETLTPESIARMTGGALDLAGYQKERESMSPTMRHWADCQCHLSHGFASQAAFGSTVLAARHGLAASKPMLERMILQGLKEVTMHEVGHTLGLRHNFKASTMLTLNEANNPEITDEKGMVASVMDYNPTNIVPKGQEQGDYYTETIGPYDYWAIEYGYKPLAGSTSDEEEALREIASKGAAEGLDYATDEDTRGIDPDPLSNRFDLGKDPLNYAKQQASLVDEIWPNLLEQVVDDGEGYQKARRAFGMLLSIYGRSMFFASRYVGGLYVHRDHKGDPEARPPFVVVEAEKQRESLALLEEKVFNDKPFEFPPELYNYLAITKWSHWGMSDPARTDYPVHEYILLWQDRILSQLLSSLTLERLHDSELKVPGDQDVLTSAELLERLTDAIFSEVTNLEEGEYTNRQPAISSLRRNLQRSYLKRLSNLALGRTSSPQDCQTVAYYELVTLQGEIKQLLAGKGRGEKSIKLDTYTKAHLMESLQRIDKVLNARLTLSAP